MPTARAAPIEPPITPATPAREAVERLLRDHGARLYALAQRLCAHTHDAQDMLQDVFLQAYRRWPTFRADARPETWLFAIAARACRARTRRKGGIDRRAPALSQLLPFAERTNLHLPDPGARSPAREAIARESARAVQQAILTLPESFRVPLVLKEMLELSVEETAQALNLKPQTVKTRVHRARLLLRKALLARRALKKGPAQTPAYDRQVCLDLLRAKLDAMDRGRGFPVAQSVVCERCRAVFAELDLAQNACAQLASGALPARLRQAIQRAIDRA
jgi:RNA polymerase sigma-70 factor (ECF subfamily)